MILAVSSIVVVVTVLVAAVVEEMEVLESTVATVENSRFRFSVRRSLLLLLLSVAIVVDKVVPFE